LVLWNRVTKEEKLMKELLRSVEQLDKLIERLVGERECRD